MEMLLCFLINVFIVSAVSLKGAADDLDLVWPVRYTVKATKWSLTSNLVEDFTAWKTNFSSRVDYNQGAVKLITIIPEVEEEDVFTKQYEIRPITTETELNKITCITMTGMYDDIDIDEILPENTEDEWFEPIGNETINGVLTIKFEFNNKTRVKEISKTVWAYYDNVGDEYVWIPVKYVEKEYNLMFGSLLKHEIWSFSGFGLDFDNASVFDVEDVCDDEDEHSWNSDKVTKDLVFIDPENENHVDHVFNNFKSKFQRKYAHELEHAKRKMIFQENMRLVRSVNRANLGYTLAINQFSDQTPKELRGSLGVVPPPPGHQDTHPFPYDEVQLNQIVNELPYEYDARIEGLVSPVKNQESCGSCWTFAAAAVTEGAITKANGGKMISLSNQAILDCAYEGLYEMDAGGCNGGYDYVAYDWIMKHGLPTDEEYGPYKNKEGYCYIGNMTEIYSIKGYTDVTPFSNNAMKVALVNHGPLFIYVHVSKKFHAYSGGIFYEDAKSCAPDCPNHGVALVGYGDRDGEPFWVLKNSWGTGWGVDGYMHISARDSVCGVSFKPTYPVV